MPGEARRAFCEAVLESARPQQALRAAIMAGYRAIMAVRWASDPGRRVDRLAPFRVQQFPSRDPVPMATLLTQLSLAEFAERTAAKEPTPGGGSVAAYIGAVGAALGVMAARFTEGRKGFEAHSEALAGDIQGLEILRGQMTQLVEADALAYATVTGAYKLPKSTPEEKEARKQAIQEGLEVALDPPLRTCRAAVEGLELLSGLAQRSNPNLISDVAVAAFALGAAYRSAWINVLINLSGLKNEAQKASLLAEGAGLAIRCRVLEDEVGGGITAKLST